MGRLFSICERDKKFLQNISQENYREKITLETEASTVG
jgi:hypothetical protein